MGKNRKAMQAVVSTDITSHDDPSSADVPIEFLTSDDFRVVVQRKRHHSKKSPDEPEDKAFANRPRSNSVKFSQSKEGHSDFWAVKPGTPSTAACASSSDDDGFEILGAEELDALPQDHIDLSSPGDCFGSATKIAMPISRGSGECGSSCIDPGTSATVEATASATRPRKPSVTFDVERSLGDCPKASEPTVNENEVGKSTNVGIESFESNDDRPSKAGVDFHAPHKKKQRKHKKKAPNVPAGPSSVVALQSSSSSEFSENASSAPLKEPESKKTCAKESKKERKRPGKKQLAAIHDALRRAQEEDERRAKEEELRRKRVEEAEKQLQELIRLEQEKKDKKKLKEKQKREKLKAEGKLLSKSQKLARARMVATLEVFRQQGVDVPQIGEKRPRGPPLSSHRKRYDSCQSDSGMGSTSDRHKSESMSSQESSGKDSLSDLPSSFDSKEGWDLNFIEELAQVSTESESVHLNCSDESGDEHSERLNPSRVIKTAPSDLPVRPKSVRLDERREDSERLRSPVVCVLGHVDTGKTKLLDYIRKTHVQDSEAGGITQQIGATMIPQDALKEKCKMARDFTSFPLEVPGLVVIDTPGHESFTNLRSRGTSVCDIAILVVDLMHGLESQTLESIRLLKKGKIPFVVALNKVDRLYGWKGARDEDIRTTLDAQDPNTLMEFKKHCQEIVLQFANECLNVSLFYENRDPRTYVSMVPTSAVTGDGMGNLLALVVQLTQSLMHKTLVFTERLQATVLEVKAIPGLGTTVDVILVNGRLREGDTVVLAGHDGPVVTQIRSLLMPHPLKELRVKNSYVEYKVVEGAHGVKITGKDLDKTLAGLPLYVASNPNDIESAKSEVWQLLNHTANAIKTSERGVYVQASTLGSLEALLSHLASMSVPYFGVKIGPVVKKDVVKASIMLEHDPTYAAILAFDVKVERDAQELADSLGVRVFQSNIIYHLCDDFVRHQEEVVRKREEARHLAVFPCILKIVPNGVNRAMDNPVVLRVTVENGTLRERTPLCVPTRKNLDLGVVSSIEVKGQPVARAKAGEEARIVLVVKDGDAPKIFFSDFDEEDCLVSRVTRQSVEICKEYCKDDLDYTEWQLMSEVRKLLHMNE